MIEGKIHTDFVWEITSMISTSNERVRGSSQIVLFFSLQPTIYAKAKKIKLRHTILVYH